MRMMTIISRGVIMQYHRLLLVLGAMSLSLGSLSGCVPPSSGNPPPSTHRAEMLGAESLSAQDQELLASIRMMIAVKPDAASVPPATLAPVRAGYAAQSLAALEAQVINGFYVGPFPSAGSLPAGYSQRPAGGWLAANPTVTTSGDTITTETYYTPDGDSVSPAAYNKITLMGEVPQFELYATPDHPVSDLPAYFKDKLTLPASYVVRLAEETYRTYASGPISGTAVGYRWSVKDDKNQLVAWVRALQVKTAAGKTLDRYEIHTGYQGGKPGKYLYATFDETAQSGQDFDQTQNPDGSFTATGTWKGDGKTLTFTELVRPDKTVQRIFACGSLVITEEYTANHSGTGSVTLDDTPRATMTWATDRQGGITLGSGSVKYEPSRWFTPVRPASGTKLGTFGVGDEPVDIMVDNDGNLWVANNDSNNLTKLSPFGQRLGTIGTGSQPRGLTKDLSGNIWVTNFGADYVSKYAPTGTQIGNYSVGDGPHAIDCAPTGHIWVTLSRNKKSSSAVKLTEAGSKIGDYQVGKEPTGLAVDSQGNVWTANYSSNDVTKLSPSGSQLARIPTGGSPIHVAIAPDGNAWVSTFKSGKIHKIAPSGGKPDTHHVGDRPRGAAFDAQGNLWVALSEADQVKKLSPTGTLLGTFGVGNDPRAIAFDKQGNAWVVNAGSDNVTKLAP